MRRLRTSFPDRDSLRSNSLNVSSTQPRFNDQGAAAVFHMARVPAYTTPLTQRGPRLKTPVTERREKHRGLLAKLRTLPHRVVSGVRSSDRVESGHRYAQFVQQVIGYEGEFGIHARINDIPTADFNG